MGANNCGGRVDPDTEIGPCNNLGDLYTSQHFCNGDPTLDVVTPNPHINPALYQAKFCDGLSAGNGEWAIEGAGATCFFDNDDRKTKVTDGSCNGSAARLGNVAICRRIKFTGDPLACCFRDSICNGVDACYSTDAERNTCAPEYREGSSHACRDTIYDYCIVDPPNETEFNNRWLTLTVPAGTTTVGPTSTTPVCQGMFFRGLYPGLVGCGRELLPAIAPDTEGLAWGKKMISGVFDRYIRNGGVVEGIYQGGMSTMLDGICRKQPGLCEDALSTFCGNISADQIARDPSLLRWCGCYLPQESYDRYSSLYGIKKECTPLCNNQQAIPLPGDGGLGRKQCRQNLCVVDNVAIDIAHSVVGTDSGINIDQICSGCIGGSCQCLVTGTTLRLLETRVGSVGITQQCQGNSTCYQEYTDSNGVKQKEEVPCDSDGSVNPATAIISNRDKAAATASNHRLIKTFIIFIVMILLIIIVWLTLPSGRSNIIPSMAMRVPSAF